MNPETQIVVDRLELVERQNRTLKMTSIVALLLSVVAVAMAFMRPASAPAEKGRFSVVETQRLLIRDLGGSVAGGIETQTDGSVRLVLGGHAGPSAHLIVPRTGAPQLTLRAIDGSVQVGLSGSDRPSVWLSPDGRQPAVSLGTAENGGGEMWLRDAYGRPRFHAP